MKRIGITGKNGFIGWHLTQYLKRREEVNLIDFERYFFDDNKRLHQFVSECDVIIHLAGLNRHSDPNIIYSKNVELVKKLIFACEKADVRPHIIFSSSSQEERSNEYGKSKKEGRILFEEWSQKNNAPFTGLIIPNVFGPFGKPFYNSVISTFSHQVVNAKEPVIEVDAELKLIDIVSLVKQISDVAFNGTYNNKLEIPHLYRQKVSSILKKLLHYKQLYKDDNIIPDLSQKFDVHLFNTFRSYINIERNPIYFKKHSDDRGDLVEILKSNNAGQVFFSTTKPGIVRGNHFHTRKVERFCVVRGTAKIQMRKIGTTDVHEFIVSGEKPSFIDMPVFFTHNLENIGKGELLTLFWTNEFFDPEDSDTFFEAVC